MAPGYTQRITSQVAIKLSDSLLDELDRLVEQGAFDSRSQAVRAGIERIVTDRRRQELDRRYREASERMPERSEDLAEATRLAVESIHEEPWDRWW